MPKKRNPPPPLIPALPLVQADELSSASPTKELARKPSTTKPSTRKKTTRKSASKGSTHSKEPISIGESAPWIDYKQYSSALPPKEILDGLHDVFLKTISQAHSPELVAVLWNMTGTKIRSLFCGMLVEIGHYHINLETGDYKTNHQKYYFHNEYDPDRTFHYALSSQKLQANYELAVQLNFPTHLLNIIHANLQLAKATENAYILSTYQKDAVFIDGTLAKDLRLQARAAANVAESMIIQRREFVIGEGLMTANVGSDLSADGTSTAALSYVNTAFNFFHHPNKAAAIIITAAAATAVTTAAATRAAATRANAVKDEMTNASGYPAAEAAAIAATATAESAAKALTATATAIAAIAVVGPPPVDYPTDETPDYLVLPDVGDDLESIDGSDSIWVHCKRPK